MTVIRVSFCLMTGAFAPQLSSFPPDSGEIAVAAVLLILFLPALRRADLAWFCLGTLLFCLHVACVAAARLPADYEADSLLVVVRITGFPESHGPATSFIARAEANERLPADLRLSWYEPPVRPRLGDVWKLQVRLRRPRGSSNPGATDAEAWMTRQRIGATGYVVDGVLNELVDAGVTSGIDRVRESIVAGIDRRLGDSDSGAVLAAIVVGARHKLTDEQWQRYARTGTSHLMAISGLHVGLAALGAYYLVRLLLGSCGAVSNQQRIALVASLAAALLYAAISGFAVPAQRAVVMLLLAGAGFLLRRDTDAFRVLAAAALLILVVDPLTTMAPGFRLSFAAVAILLWFARRSSPPARGAPARSIAAIRKLAAVQLVLFVGLLPLTALIFDRVSLSAPVVNFVAVPIFSMLTVPLALLSVVFAGPLEPVGAQLLGIAARSIDVIELLIGTAAAEPRSARAIAAISGIAWLAVALPIAWIVLPAGWPGRYAACIGIAVLLGWRPQGPPRGCTDVTVLDVGQGLAAVVRTGERVLLFDTGPRYRNGGSAAQHVVLPFLASIGARHIDRMIVSHADQDHAGGVADVTRTLPVDDVLSGEPLSGSPARPCHDGLAWYWGTTRFTVLHPPADTVHSGNDASCVLLVETGERRTLLTGDIEAPAEASLVRRGVVPRVGVVTIPHHGSRTSSIAPFVRSLSPGYAIVSAAYANQWGFPKPDVVARWRANGATVLNTAASGAVSVRQCDDNAPDEVQRYRQAASRIWHDAGQDAEF